VPALGRVRMRRWAPMLAARSRITVRPQWAFAAGVEELGFDADAVVADGYAKLAGGVGDLNRDARSLGMAEGVEERFASD